MAHAGLLPAAPAAAWKQGWSLCRDLAQRLLAGAPLHAHVRTIRPCMQMPLSLFIYGQCMLVSLVDCFGKCVLCPKLSNSKGLFNRFRDVL